MFAKDKVSQSMIDAVNKVLTTESNIKKEPEKLDEAFPTVADAKKRASEPKPRGDSGIKLGTRYGGGRQADAPEEDDDEPKKKGLTGAHQKRRTNTKLYKEEGLEGSKKDKEEDKKLAKKHGMTAAQWEKSSADKKHDMQEEKWEGSKKDKEEDEKLAKKHGMTLTQWEKSSADKKHDMEEELIGKQRNIDANKNGKIDAQDFEILRSKKKKMNEESFAARLVESMYGKKSALPMDEREMTDTETKKKEEIAKAMKRTPADVADMKKRYGSRWKEVLYATATKRAMKEAEEHEDEDEEGHEDEKQDKALLKKMVKKSALKEEEQLDELKKSTVASYIQKKFGKMSDEPVSKNQYGYTKKDAKGIRDAGLRMSGIKATQKEEVEELDELSKSTVKSYLFKKMHQPTTTKKDVDNLGKAYARLKDYKPTSEEVEQMDEKLDYSTRTTDTLAGRVRGGHDNEHYSSKVKLETKKLKSFSAMKKEMLGKDGMTSEENDE